ncbi:peptidoglycan-binding protein [Desulfovibrio sulfodismutans]|uniref:Peptidoglycan-binding protein n=2 Tax=Desulfolutivibrio sulfodismutans TaxID=63561 RepID=A0A7K3NJM1_9BACT|nr:peptidoglycan-binding protein [Desulfolutivibrio sulfodismutans]QLA14536.1 peptidoglycan-binding protein [Desulfolutivibrio sulfodismutans DSM 3696]
MGVLLPGVTYEPPKAILGLTDAATPCFELDSPYQRGPAIRTIQAALAANGIHPGAMDGVFGPMLHAAVLAFQAARGLTPDGIVGSETAQALGISWPIPLLADDLWSAASPPTTPARPDEPGPEDVRPANADPAQDNAVTFTFEFASGRHYATASTGMRLCLGSPQHHVDDMPRLGLAQKPAHLAHLAIAGVYDPKDFDASHPGWSAFLHPTILAESGGYFGRINSYDRAGFTFGCPQFAAHTPGANLILLFRRLLTLPTARSYFPDLSLETDGQGEPRVHCLDQHGRMQNLETASQVLRPNGRTELQLLDFMRYLNANPVEVDQAELLALARLILWCVEDDEARRAQVDLAVTTSQKKLAAAAKKIPDLEGKPWQEACMVFDILHQGRGRYADIAAALEEHDPLEALSRVSIGPLPVQRIKTVRAVMDAITQQGVLNDWSPWDDIFG